MPALLLTTDLGCSSKVTGAAARNSALAVETAMTVARLLEKAAAGDYPLVLLDLNSAGVDPREIVPKLKALAHPPRAIVAFGPHVHEDKLQAAADAGCDAVLTRGQFFAQVDQILAEYLA